ncbi:queuine tRNA-ribosyltransferase accessory subunit isoform X1 [Lates japonicus]|uniref:Queuine tRNA-ribosyltransferase accessory subunit isoform X1 n=1 Tax=Lates japonicus TaxID=270547 RepID=A0AAD3MIV3_LATJO|nr:queuine tRNA-ribosyltransferase accessory subunit isoform X1 [Lates japonicus]
MVSDLRRNEFLSANYKTLLGLEVRYQDGFPGPGGGVWLLLLQEPPEAYSPPKLVTNELLAGVLPMIHNTAHYHGFFSSLREALANDQLDLLKSRVLRRERRQTERKE